MLSRMAESLYWIGRYVERAEQTARHHGGDLPPHARHGLDGRGGRAPRPPLGGAARHRRRARRVPAGRPAVDEENVPSHLIFSAENPNSIVECIARARDNARTHAPPGGDRDVGGAEPLPPRGAAAGPAPARGRRRRERHLLLPLGGRVQPTLQGITDSTMPREEGWYFLQAGKFLERAERTARTLDVNYRLLVGDDAEQRRPLRPRRGRSRPAAVGHVLRSLSAYESYYRISSSGVQPSGVIELLTLSPVLPRSIRFSIGQVDAALAPHQRAGADLQRLRADAGRGRRERGAARGRAACTRSSRTSGSRTCSTAACTRSLLDIQRHCYRVGERDRGRVLRPPAADGAGADGVRYRIRHRTSYRYASASSRASTRCACSRSPARRRRCSTSTS